MEAAGATKIKSSGLNLVSCCPFHDDAHRSFSMNTETGQYCCFSETCGAQGGLVSFLMKGIGYGHKRAHAMAERFGAFADIKGDGAWVEMPDWADRFVFNKALGSWSGVKHVEERILGLYDFCPRYLLKRGFDKSVLKEWEIGYDFETKHVTIPVRDVESKCVGISRRVTWATDSAKYLHLEFQKSQYLYGAHKISTPATCWIGEGQLDAVALSQMGQDAVSTMGARVSNAQISLLSDHGVVILAFDADGDGKRATVKVGEGLIEAGMGRHVYVADHYPFGAKDPADVLRRHPRDRKRFLEELVPYDEWRAEALFHSDLIKGNVQRWKAKEI